MKNIEEIGLDGFPVIFVNCVTKRPSFCQIEIIFLIWSIRGLSSLLELNKNPNIVIQHNEIRNALQVSRVVLHNDGCWELGNNLLDYFSLNIRFDPGILLSLKMEERRRVSSKTRRRKRRLPHLSIMCNADEPPKYVPYGTYH